MTAPTCPHCQHPLDEATLRAAAAVGLARARAAAREQGALTGRPPKRTRCPKCQMWCCSATAARAHCRR